VYVQLFKTNRQSSVLSPNMRVLSGILDWLSTRATALKRSNVERWKLASTTVCTLMRWNLPVCLS